MSEMTISEAIERLINIRNIEGDIPVTVNVWHSKTKTDVYHWDFDIMMIPGREYLSIRVSE